MGGITSGRRLANPKKTTESAVALSIQWFKKHDALREGVRGTIEMKSQYRTSVLGFSVSEGDISLYYTISCESLIRNQLEYRIPLQWTSCHYGGGRPWFLCPKCGRRSGILYFVPTADYFLCRLCQNLTYECQKESESYRALRQMYRYRERLGIKGTLLQRHTWEKPKHMKFSKFIHLQMRLLRHSNKFVQKGHAL